MKKYVTVDKKSSDGLGYREISEIMTSNGDKMNHMTVKNIITRGFSKIAKHVSTSYGKSYKSDELYKIAQSPDFQLSVIEIMKSELNNEK